MQWEPPIKRLPVNNKEVWQLWRATPGFLTPLHKETEYSGQNKPSQATGSPIYGGQPTTILLKYGTRQSMDPDKPKEKKCTISRPATRISNKGEDYSKR
jgi:hypothetical protein